MLQWAIHIAYGSLGISMLLAVYRVCVGPTVLDRAVAFDTFSSNLIGLICIMAIQTQDSVHFDLSIMISLLPFMVNIVVAKFVVKGVIIDRDPDSALLIIGAVLMFAGSFGLARFPDFFHRIHAAGIPGTLGAVPRC